MIGRLNLTDVFALIVEDDAITHFVYSEVKSGTTRPNSEVGADGYADLVKTSRQAIPEILYFTHERLDESQRYEDRDRPRECHVSRGPNTKPFSPRIGV